MEAADWLYGVSMGEDGVSKVLSRRLPSEQAAVARGRRGRLRRGSSMSAAIVARPVARDWSELFITGDDGQSAGSAGEGGGGTPGASASAAPARWAVAPPAREHGQDASGARQRDPGDAVRGARRAHVGTPGGGADHGRRRRQHHRVGGGDARGGGVRGRARGRSGAQRAADRAARRDRDASATAASTSGPSPR